MIALVWTEEMTETLWRMHCDGANSREISEVVGRNRNAVIGKIHRERIKRGLAVGWNAETPKPKPVAAETVEKRKYTRIVPEPSVDAKGIGVILPTIVPKPEFVIKGEPVSIVNVTGCRWPVGFDAKKPGGHLFCNCEVARGKPYCAEHAALNVASYSTTLIKETIKDVVLRFRAGRAA